MKTKMEVMQLKGSDSKSQEERVTSHAQPQQQTDEDILRGFTDEARLYLKAGNIGLLRLARVLCQAEEALKRGESLSESGETSLVRWCEEELGLSEDRSKRLRRWGRPFLDKIDWQDDEDPLLNELAEVGPCRADEMFKEGISWEVTADKELVINLSSGEKKLVREMSVREIRALRQPPQVEGAGGPPQEVSTGLTALQRDDAHCEDLEELVRSATDEAEEVEQPSQTPEIQPIAVETEPNGVPETPAGGDIDEEREQGNQEASTKLPRTTEERLRDLRQRYRELQVRAKELEEENAELEARVIAAETERDQLMEENQELRETLALVSAQAFDESLELVEVG